MDSIKVKTSAKINLSLDVVGRKPDGYHLIESIFQSVNIYDIITVSKTENGIHLTCNEPEIPCDSRNIAYKAARLFLDKTGIKSGSKNIYRLRQDLAAAAQTVQAFFTQ